MIVDGVNIEILTLEALNGIKTALWYVGTMIVFVGACLMTK